MFGVILNKLSDCVNSAFALGGPRPIDPAAKDFPAGRDEADETDREFARRTAPKARPLADGASRPAEKLVLGTRPPLG